MSETMASWIRGFLVIAAVGMVVGAFIALMGAEIPDKNRDAVMILIGALIARSEKIDSFFFGSSKASEEKNAVIASMASGPAQSDPLDLTGAEIPPGST